MSLADQAKQAMDEITFDAHPGFNNDISKVYEALDKLKEMEEAASESELSDNLRSIAHELPNSKADVLEAGARRIEQLEQEAAEASWKGCVDRQGGSFDQEEMDPMRGWK